MAAALITFLEKTWPWCCSHETTLLLLALNSISEYLYFFGSTYIIKQIEELIKLMHFDPFLFEHWLFINQTKCNLTVLLKSVWKVNRLLKARCAYVVNEILMNESATLRRSLLHL